MKLFKFTAAILCSALLFAGCSKGEKVRKPSKNIDSTTWINNLIDGKAAAAKENKKIILYFSVDDQDQVSAGLKETVLNTPEFLENLTKKYVLINLDFSNSLLDASRADPLASDEEKKAAAAVAERIQENTESATLYNPVTSPSFFLLTKEGYVITELPVEPSLGSAEEFNQIIEEKAEVIAEYMNVLESTKTGSVTEKVSAIERLFDITPAEQRYPLSDFSEKVVSLDKKNESGVVGKHAVALANAKALRHYVRHDSEKASAEFAAVTKNKYLSAEEKQQCFYTAGYLLAQSGSNNYKQIADYFQQAYDASPESEYAPMMLQMVNMAKEREAELNGYTSDEAPVAEEPVQEAVEAPAEAASAN